MYLVLGPYFDGKGALKVEKFLDMYLVLDLLKLGDLRTFNGVVFQGMLCRTHGVQYHGPDNGMSSSIQL